MLLVKTNELQGNFNFDKFDTNSKYEIFVILN